jgi:hypothetical protein
MKPYAITTRGVHLLCHIYARLQMREGLQAAAAQRHHRLAGSDIPQHLQGEL